jgi:hypothetical protein
MLAGLYGFVLALILVMRFAPASALGRLLLAQLVEKPLASLSALKSYQLIAFVLMGVTFLVGGEAIMLFGPELFTVYLIDLSIYLDAVAVTYALAAMARAKQGWRAIRLRLVAAASRLRPGRGHRRARRKPTLRPAKPADNDDEPDALPVAA